MMVFLSATKVEQSRPGLVIRSVAGDWIHANYDVLKLGDKKRLTSQDIILNWNNRFNLAGKEARMRKILFIRHFAAENSKKKILDHYQKNSGRLDPC